jgi:hypothetical protein
MATVKNIVRFYIKLLPVVGSLYTLEIYLAFVIFCCYSVDVPVLDPFFLKVLGNVVYFSVI